MTTFFIGDTHFGHTNIIQFEPVKRPFKTIHEHDEALVHRWNSVVTPDDTVWHLGDVFFGQDTRAERYISRLNGHKNLVMGNHDKARYMELFSKYFERVCGAAYYKDGLLTHIPVHPKQLESRFKWNIHGHLHSANIRDARYVNVSCEQIDLTPIPWEAVKRILNTP